jgi:diguanylate cyclase (GGDEF)-like protein/PAS domain S-box-containing protein
MYGMGLVLAGAAALAFALVQLPHLPTPLLGQVFAAAVVATIVGIYPVRIRGTRLSIAGAEIFIFLTLIVAGVPAAIVVAAVESFASSWRNTRNPMVRIATPAIAALAMLLAGMAYEALGSSLEARGVRIPGTFLAAILASTLYFAANTTLLAALMSLQRGERIEPLQAVLQMRWVALAYAIGAAVAATVHLGTVSYGPFVVIAFVPLVFMVLSMLNQQFERAELEAEHFEQLRDCEQRFKTAFSHAAIGMALVRFNGEIQQANAAFCDMLGRKSKELVAGDLLALVLPDDRQILQGYVDSLVADKVLQVHAEVRGLHSDGRIVWMAMHMSFARDWRTKEAGMIVQVQDISLRRRVEDELNHNAHHDALTQLSNRAHFSEQLNRALARARRRPEQRFAVLYLDFDRFKMVNESLGHDAGDELLVEVARRLQAAIRPTDFIARLGGDEFAILAEAVERDRDAFELAERIQKELQKGVHLRDMEVATSASIGITFSSGDYRTADQMIRDADIAMYKAKSLGKGRCALFDGSLHEHVTSQLKVETELRRAIGQGQMLLHYQPIYELHDSQVVGFEALVRWRHPEQGLLDPGKFIPIAEETGLIVPLGNWILAAACQQMRAWQDTIPGARRLRMSVNVSSVQLSQPDFVQRVRRVLEETPLAPESLTIEVTESVLMSAFDDAVAKLAELRSLGIAISIDDFGTGYSSLSYLVRLPLDHLKIDRSFIDDIHKVGQGNEIVRAVLKLGQALGKRVCAEGIETAAQLALLRELGCEYGQGYLMSRPVTADDAKTAITAQRVEFAVA